jgi:polyisoprenoid-binding protein YceI
MSATSTEQIPAGSFAVDPLHSTVGFSVKHSGVSIFRNRFRDYEVSFEGGQDPRLTGTVVAASIDIDDEQFKGHLLSPDFFDVQKHPQLRFSSTELSIEEDGSVRLAGDLEIRGETHSVQASGRFGQIGADLAGRERLGLSLEAAVDRRDFGLAWNADLPGGGQVLEYEVTIDVDLELVPAGS